MPTLNTVADLIEGFEHVETRHELEQRFALGRPLRVKLGLDPTSPDLHLGHTVILERLQRFVAAGHHVMLVIGDFTARIGDPSGRNESRPPLDDRQIAVNMKTYAEQAGKVLDMEKVELRYNSEWLQALSLDGLIRLFSHVTVAQMLKREDFANRHAAGVPIALHEFLYPIAQAYDSVELKADIELGGNDQLFNILMGRHYQTIFQQPPQICLTAPLLEGLDGIKKMSKSLGNAIGLAESPNEQFGKTMRIQDELIGRWAHLVLAQPRAQTENLSAAIANGSTHPMEEKKKIAWSIVQRYHGNAAADAAREHFERTVQRSELPQEMPLLKAALGIRITDLLIKAGFADSKRAAQRLIEGGGTRIDGSVLNDVHAVWQKTSGVLSVGSRQFIRIEAQ